MQAAARDVRLSVIVALRRCVAPHWLKIILLAVSLCASGDGWVLAQTAPSQAPQHQFGDARDCPPGYRIEFVLPATTIYVDPRWLGSSTIVDLQHMGGPACPTGSVTRKGIELGYGILRAMGVHRGIGSGLMRFDVGGDPNDPQTLTPARTAPDSEPPRSAPWIEDDTVLKSVPDSRAYRIYYPTPKNVPNRPVNISCGGAGIHRLCRKDAIAGRNTPFDGVHYGYIVSQSDMPFPNLAPEYSTDPTSEPGALLEFDSRFREWFLSLRQRP